MRTFWKSTLAFAALFILFVSADTSAATQSPATSTTSSGKKHHDKHHRAAARDTTKADSTVILGTPGSPTGAESRGMPGEKPIPGTKK